MLYIYIYIFHARMLQSLGRMRVEAPPDFFDEVYIYINGCIYICVCVCIYIYIYIPREDAAVARPDASRGAARLFHEVIYIYKCVCVCVYI